MLNLAQNIFLIAFWITLSVIFLFLFNRLWPPARRRVHNDVIGWQISILGVIYAVIIGFMMGSVWANYQAAETNVDHEANAAINLYRASQGLPTAQRNAVQSAVSNYVTAVVTQEWPAMSHSQTPTAGKPYLTQMWATLTRTPTETPVQRISLQESMQQLSSLTRHRRIRVLDSRSGMPNILWAVLIIGGVITTTACCLIGTENVALHFALVFAVSLLISLALVAIADIDRAFQGSVHVETYAFVRAQESVRNATPVHH